MTQQQQQQQQIAPDAVVEQIAPDAVFELISLPPDVLRMIWERLATPRVVDDADGLHSPGVVAPPDQLALRSCCRAARDACSAFISSLHVSLHFPTILQEQQQQQEKQRLHGSSCSSEEHDGAAAGEAAAPQLLVMREARRQLTSFPAASACVHLTVSYEHNQQDVHARCKWPFTQSCHVEYPSLLPGLLHARTLETITHLHLHGDAAVTADDIEHIAAACPALQLLDLSFIAVLTQPCSSSVAAPPQEPSPAARAPVLSALSRLRSLRAVTARGVWCPQGGQGELGAQLCQLPQLLQLRVSSSEQLAPGGDTYLGLSTADVLPHLGGLAALRSLMLRLRLSLRPDDSRQWDLQLFTHLSRLSSLAHLKLEAVEDVGMMLRLGCDDIRFPPSLVSLDTDYHVDASVVQALALLPHLEEVKAWDLPLGDSRDLSEVPHPGWRRVELSSCSLSEVGRLPLRGCTRLHVRQPLRCTLGASTELQATCCMLHKAALVLAAAWDAERAGPRLDFNTAPAAVSRPPAPGFPRHLLLASLAPLGRMRRLGLAFDEGWDLGEQLLQQLEEHLPNLEGVFVNPRAPGFQYFTAALATRLPQLRKLVVHDDELMLMLSAVLSQLLFPDLPGLALQPVEAVRDNARSQIEPVQAMLVQLAQGRLASGLSLHIHSSCIVDAKRLNKELQPAEECQAVVFQHGICCDEW